MTEDSKTESEEIEGDDATDERQLIGERREETAAFVAAEIGIVEVSLAADRVGQFSLFHQCQPRSVAAREERLVAGTDTDVLVIEDGAVESTGFGPAVAVGLTADRILAADSDGRVAQFVDDEWSTVGSVRDAREFHGDLLAADSGLYRVTDSLDSLGLSNVTSVTDGPVAATADGLFHDDHGEWERRFEGSVTAVSGSGTRLAALDSVGVLTYTDREWQRMATPGDSVPAVLAYGESLYAVTPEGEFLVYTDPELVVDGREGWRSHVLGLGGVEDIALR